MTASELTDPEAALMIEVEPTEIPVASPWEFAALLISATLELEDAQVTAVVKIWVELSV